MKNTSVNRKIEDNLISVNQSIIHFLCFTVSAFLLASPFLIGCGDSDDDLPETATVIVEVISPALAELETDALSLSVSTNFREGSNSYIFLTQQDFFVINNFERDFLLDADWPRIAIRLENTTSSGPLITAGGGIYINGVYYGNQLGNDRGTDITVRIKLLLDGEVDMDETALLEPGTVITWTRFQSKE